MKASFHDQPSLSDRAIVLFVSVENMMRLGHHVSIKTMLRGLASHFESRFQRWETFYNTRRVASHAAGGAIEWMPTSDDKAGGFKFVNGRPKTTGEEFQVVTAIGRLADIHTRYSVLLTEMIARRAAASSAIGPNSNSKRWR